MPCCLRLLAIRVAPSTSLMLSSSYFRARDYALMARPRKGFAGSTTARRPPRCARTQPPSPCAVHGRTASQSTPWCRASSAPTLTRRARGVADRQATEDCFAARAMMGCVGEPQDVANAVVFLASPQSGWITAQTLTVYGGRMDYIGHG